MFVNIYLSFHIGSGGKESACDAGELGSVRGQEDPLEKRMATHTSVLAWRVPWAEEPGGLSPCSLKESHAAQRFTHTHTHVHTHAVESYSAVKNKAMASVATWMGLGVIILRK